MKRPKRDKVEMRKMRRKPLPKPLHATQPTTRTSSIQSLLNAGAPNPTYIHTMYIHTYIHTICMHIGKMYPLQVSVSLLQPLCLKNNSCPRTFGAQMSGRQTQSHPPLLPPHSSLSIPLTLPPSPSPATVPGRTSTTQQNTTATRSQSDSSSPHTSLS